MEWFHFSSFNQLFFLWRKALNSLFSSLLVWLYCEEMGYGLRQPNKQERSKSISFIFSINWLKWNERDWRECCCWGVKHITFIPQLKRFIFLWRKQQHNLTSFNHLIPLKKKSKLSFFFPFDQLNSWNWLDGIKKDIITV